MPALRSLSQRRSPLRPRVTRHRPWTMCCVVILGCIGSHHGEALTSLCRVWRMEEAGAHPRRPFFQASAWCLEAVVAPWSRLVCAPPVAVMGQGRAGV